nr:MAG TPA: hypothetical protein [Caudoviricetes sp.]
MYLLIISSTSGFSSLFSYLKRRYLPAART